MAYACSHISEIPQIIPYYFKHIIKAQLKVRKMSILINFIERSTTNQTSQCPKFGFIPYKMLE